MIDYAEKRDFLRMPIDCELSFSETGSSKQYSGNVINLSSKGILFTSNQEFAPGAKLDITLTPSNSITPPMEASVVVMRVVNNEVMYEIACEIKEIKS
ncbi:MAG: PilZ domain-containing protein [Gammaproteobacteria bacterium]|nr:MAG: PilZ domain-containing protein [Gammaproteobacteria bacterium]UCH41006.1 MAG: PilZ domain-containing protein [Gammaproteobacteria bacterium]